MATTDDVKKLAALARIEIPETSLDSFTKEFDAVLAYVGTLDALDLSQHVASGGMVRNVLREDAEPHAPGIHTEKLAEQFPKREGNHLSVKQIISYD